MVLLKCESFCKVDFEGFLFVTNSLILTVLLQCESFCKVDLVGFHPFTLTPWC